MKKTIFASLIVASSALTINNAFAEDGEIKFTGEITDVACQLATGSDSFVVNLGKVSKASLSGTGTTAAATKFTIKLENCPDTVTSASVKFDGKSYPGDNSVLQLSESSLPTTAKNVGIQIQDISEKAVPLFTSSTSYKLEKNVVNNLDFTARYIAMSDDVGVGQANSTATFTINYN